MHVIGFLTLIAVQAAVLGSSLHDDTITEFSVKIYHKLRATKEDENIFFSPLSIALAVGMVELGARGSSLKEIRHALGYDKLKNGEEFSLLKDLSSMMTAQERHYVLSIANSLYLQNGFHISDKFIQLMKKYFKAEVENVDFSQGSAVENHINAWVENHTNSTLSASIEYLGQFLITRRFPAIFPSITIVSVKFVIFCLFFCLFSLLAKDKQDVFWLHNSFIYQTLALPYFIKFLFSFGD